MSGVAQPATNTEHVVSSSRTKSSGVLLRPPATSSHSFARPFLSFRIMHHKGTVNIKTHTHTHTEAVHCATRYALGPSPQHHRNRNRNKDARHQRNPAAQTHT
ncbi:hypothetical protein Vretimale_4006 [Volvox reticuliferus]|uniref:Uncharacterized protein n=1 Tax=Volvox reticuliferus TaxID=1737510 RepID=A0A8J4DFT8_9CHLO|nr:hypothetical protein Vretimale_4006 [Volvox reticuliferus]